VGSAKVLEGNKTGEVREGGEELYRGDNDKDGRAKKRIEALPQSSIRKSGIGDKREKDNGHRAGKK